MNQLLDSFSSKSLNKQASFSIFNTSKKHLLSELLPYDPKEKDKSRLMAGLKEYNFLLIVSETAVERLRKGDFSQFDPLVGENACQIRALKNCLLFSNYPSSRTLLLKELRFARKNMHTLLKRASATIKHPLSLAQVLEGLDVQLTYGELYLIQSYLLTIVKESRPPKELTPFVKNEYTSTKKLKSIQPVGTMFAEKLIKKLRISLSAFSVSFVKEISKRILPKILHTTSDRFYLRHNHLHCLPCYWVTKLVMMQALKSQTPLAIVVRQLAKDQSYAVLREMPLFFKSTRFEYKPSSLCSFNTNSPALVLLVNSCKKTQEFLSLAAWKKDLLTYNPIDLILAYAAAHRQYPDTTKNDLVNEMQDKEYFFHKKKAYEWGCSIENPSYFFLSHAFCEKIEQVSNHISLEYGSLESGFQATPPPFLTEKKSFYFYILIKDFTQTNFFPLFDPYKSHKARINKRHLFS